MKLRRIGLYGINCTGKTTVAKKISELHPNYEFIDGSDIINKVCPGGLSEFKKLNTFEKYNVRETAINYLKNYQNKIKKHLVIAGHYSFLQDDNTFEIALTRADVQFYTDIFSLYFTKEVHYSTKSLERSSAYVFPFGMGYAHDMFDIDGDTPDFKSFTLLVSCIKK